MRELSRAPLPPLVDREEEVARIAEALDAAERGEGQLLLLRGEAGCGKTRLVQEAAAPDDFQSDWREGRGRQGAGCVGGT